MPSLEDIISGMEYQTLTAIKGLPNYENINPIRRQIYANAASVESLRSGTHGQLGKIISAATYLTVTETSYNNPPNPGPLSPQPAAAFPTQWDGNKAEHKRALDE
jgi:hypothetical protein